MHEIGRREELQLFLSYAAANSARLAMQIAERFPDAEEAFSEAKAHNAAAFDFVTERVRLRLFEAAGDGFLDSVCTWLTENGVGVSIPAHEDYPKLLKEIHDPPTVLFYKGRLMPEPQLAIAVVGSRKCTRYGRDIAKLFSFDLAKRGATVVSGMALGVDAAAARGALDCAEADDPTIAVLGTGIDVIYPRANEKLYYEIIERGSVVTEFWPGSAAVPEHFPMRNRIISGLSNGVFITEAAERSGTSITANCALEQGRDVFAAPGRITDEMSRGTNSLIQQGAAKPVFCTADILCEYGMASEREKTARVRYAADTAQLTELEKRITNALRTGEKDADELMDLLAVSATDLNCGLTALEFSGIIKPLPGRLFALELQ